MTLTQSIINSVSVICFILFCVWQLRFRSSVFWYILPFNINHLWIILSNNYIESGAYLREQYAFGDFCWSTSIFSIYSIIFSLVFQLVCQVLKIDWSALYRIKVSDLKKAFFGITTCYAVLGIFALLRGSPVFTGQSRFEFLEEVGFFAKKMYLFHYCSGFLVGVGLNHSSLRRNAAICCISTLLTCVLMGDKFSAIFWTLLAVLGGFYIKPRRRTAKKQINQINFSRNESLSTTKTGIFAIGLLIVPIWGYTNYHNIEIGGLGDEILARVFADQGAVWHGVCRLVLNGQQRLDFSTIFAADTIETPSGINALMYIVTDPRFAQMSREAGISFTMGYLGVMVYNFGFGFGMIIAQIAPAVIALISKTLINSAAKSNIILFIVSVNTYYVCQDIFLMGRTWKIIGWQMVPIICVSLILLATGVKSVNSRKTTERFNQYKHEQ